MTPDEAARYALEQHEQERHVLFGNEAFAIGMLQTVALTASIAVGSDLATVHGLVGPLFALPVFTALLLALALAIAASYCRHQYKLHGIKATIAAAERERRRHMFWTALHLTCMRWFIAASTALLVSTILIAVGALWWPYVCEFRLFC